MTGLTQLFTMPPKYRAETAWGPFQAVLATIVIVVAPMVILSALLAYQTATGAAGSIDSSFLKDVVSLSTPAGVLALISSQLVSLVLVWAFAGRGGLRWPTLGLAPPSPSYKFCIAIALVFIAALGLVELALYYFVQFDPFKDSKFLVEGLRSEMWFGTLLAAVVLAPLWEELTFRGFLLSALAKSRLGIVGGGLVSNGLWAALHASYSLPALLSVFTAGLAITWLVWKTGNLRVAIVTHALVNASAAVFTGVFSPY